MTPFPSYPSHIRSKDFTAMIDRYHDQFPDIRKMVRRGYSAERIAELVGCEIWIPKAIKFSGRW